jgi:hypothetical protein
MMDAPDDFRERVTRAMDAMRSEINALAEAPQADLVWCRVVEDLGDGLYRVEPINPACRGSSDRA